MIYDPKTESVVFLTVKELGEGTTEEISNYLAKHEKLELDTKLLQRYLRRWKARKLISAAYHDGEVLWKLADIPPWYVSGIMALVKGTTNADMRTALDALNERLKKQGRIVEPKGAWGTYIHAELTFETIDPILGGWIGPNDGELIVPRRGKQRFIPANWFKGWIGSNAALIDLPQSVRFHIQVNNAELPDFKSEIYQLKVKMGLCTYEAIPPKTRFTTKWAFPTRGAKLKALDEWQHFIEMFSENPLRGLGANPYALGGRVKLVEIKQL